MEKDIEKKELAAKRMLNALLSRRKFIGQTSLVMAGLLAGCRKSLFAEPAPAVRTIRGKVFSAGRAVSGVVMSDGYSVVATDEKGRYEIDPHPDAVCLFASVPAGHAFPNESGIARHYRQIKGMNTKDADFNFERLDRSDEEHQFFIWADPQVKNKKDVDKMMTISVPDTRKTINSAPAGTLQHGITVGDIVWDNHALFADYDKAVAEMSIPFFQCIGNHDQDYNQGGDEASDDTFQATYGPTNYSFNRGQVHYVVMDNVRYLGKDREYDGYFQSHHLEWLKKDLSFVAKDKLIVLCVHIPVHNGVKNNEEIYSILKDRKVHIMSGHTHYHRNVLRDNVFEHNHGTVCGAWWTGPVCCDGTPNGYGVYNVKGNELSWHYQSTGRDATHQIALYQKQGTGTEKMILANIWNHDPAWTTRVKVDGIEKGSLEQITDFDPYAYETLLGLDLPKPRGFAEPRKTEHMFQVSIPGDAKEVSVEATDRFGTTFMQTLKLV